MTSTSYDPSTALSLYHTSRATTTTARLWAAEKLLHDFSQIGMFQFFEGPGPDPTGLLNYASNKIWMKTAAGVTAAQATFHVWLGDGLASDENNWVDLDQTTFQLWLQDSAASEAAAAKASATSAENAAEIATLLAGVAAVYATNAEMAAAASGIAANAIVLVLTDETQGSLAALYKKIAGVMVLQRVVGATGNIVDVRRFGIVGGSDETAKFEVMRQYLIANDGSTVVFRPGVTYQHRNPKFLCGVKNVTVIAYGAKFENLGRLDATGDSPLYCAVYLGAGSWNYQSTTAPTIDGGGNPLVATTSGYLLEDVAAGASTVTMTTTAEAANFVAGQNVLIYHGVRQAASAPPNPADWEYNVVESVNAGTGVVTLARPASHVYRKTQPESTTYSITWGKARIIPLNRANYNIAERITWLGGECIPSGEAWFDGGLLVTGALSVTIRDAKMGVFGPSMVKHLHVENCQSYGLNEIDKMIDELTFVDCHIHDLNQSTGVRDLVLEGGSVFGTICQVRARNVRFAGVDIKSNPTSGYKTQMGHDQFPCHHLRVENCVFYPDAASVSGLVAGNSTSFVADAVTATSIVVNAANASYAQIRQNIDVGQRITVGSGAAADVFTVTGYTFDGSGNMTILGYAMSSSPPAASATRSLWATTKVTFAGNRYVNRQVAWQPAEFYQRAYDMRANDNEYIFDLRDASANEYSLLGIPAEIIVDVIRPYTGSDTTVVLDMGLSGPGVSWGGAQINVKTAGRRVIGLGSTAGAVSGDTLNSLGNYRVASSIALYLQKSPAPPYGTYTDGAESSKPIVRVTVKVAKV